MLNNIKTKFKNRKKGFSLIEMVVVIAIMAILALIMVPNLTAYIQKGDDAQIKANIKNVHTAAELIIQSDPGMSVKDIGTARTGKYASAAAVAAEIEKFANLPDVIGASTNSTVVLAATAPAGTGLTTERQYTISPTADGKILVTYSSDRVRYSFNGTAYTP